MRGCASGGSNAAKPGKTPGRTPRRCPRPRRYCRQRDKTVPKQSRGSPFQCCLAKPQYPCACKNHAHSLLQQILWRLCQCRREGCSAVLKQIRGDSFQCWEEWWARVGKFCRNKKERLFCKRPHYPMLKRKNGLFPVPRPALPSAAVGRLALHNIEEGGGRTVSEVGERYFCKHRYSMVMLLAFTF